ncbi:MAG: hypothetical protein IJA58_05155 [Lachnospiraceae bacterium]|nr:hypothetical protein [Lachnospiraceae bacterium]
MRQYDAELRELEAMASSVERLGTRLNRMLEQQRQLQRREAELGAIRAVEQDDVDKLKMRSLARFFLLISGKLDEKIDQEQREAYEATVKYDAVLAEIRALESEIGDLRREIRQAEEAKARYDLVLEEKREAIRASGSAVAQEMLEIEERLAVLAEQKREINEALNAGTIAMGLVEDIREKLSSAKNWSTWDLMGGGLIAEVEKHVQLDQAQQMVENLQIQLERFRNELADVAIDGCKMQVNIQGGLRFADVFFDGLFVNWAVHNRIDGSGEQVRLVGRQVEKACAQLKEMKKSTEQELVRLETRREQLIRRE